MPALAVRNRLPRPDDPDILERIEDSISKGHPIATAAHRAGIGEMTVRDWLRAGEVALAEHPECTPQELGSHALFAWTFKDAEARFVERNLAAINGAVEPTAKGWIPAMTLLERRRPQDFGRREYRETKTETRLLSVNLTASLDPAQAQALIETLQDYTASQALLHPGGTHPTLTTAVPEAD